MKSDDSVCTQDARGLVTLARIETHEKIIQFLQNERRGKLLDVPSGTGILSSKLKEFGFECCCCDINPEMFKAQGIEFKVADLNKSVPLETNHFDFITCIDGLEHLENPHNAIREFKRLLKKVGSYLSQYLTI